MHLPDAFWAYRNSRKSATDARKEKEEEVFVAERHEDLEGLDEKREKA